MGRLGKMDQQINIEQFSAFDEEVLPPIHAGDVLRTEFIEPMGVSAVDLACMIAVKPELVEKILNREEGISGDLAQRLNNRFGIGAEFWIGLQEKYATDHIAFTDLKDELLQDYETGAK